MRPARSNYDYGGYGYYGAGQRQESRRVEYPDRFRPFIEEPKAKTLSPGVITAHSIGGPEITNPTHGMSGWKDGELFIWDGQWDSPPGWRTLAVYQAAKNRDKAWRARLAEHRIMPFSHYRDGF